MKKLILLISALLMLTSCGKGAERAVTYDCDNNFQQYSMPMICGDDDTLFFAFDDGSQLWYYDKATGISGLLCGKPECTHNGTECNAYFVGSELSLYGGKIYSLKPFYGSGCEVFSSDIDGSNRKTVIDLVGSEFSNMLADSVSDLSGKFHRGYFYACGTHHMIIDGILNDHAQVFAYSLDGGKGGIIYDNTELTAIKIQPFDDYLYFVAYSDDAIEVCRYSPESGEVEVLYNGDMPFSSPKIWVTDDSILFGDISESAIVYKLDFANGTITSLFDFNSDTDKPYLLYGFTDDYIVGGNMNGIEYLLCLKDYDGKTILETTVTPPNISDDEPLYTFPCGSDDEYIYLWSKVWSNAHDVQFIIGVSLKDGKSEVLWTNDI